MKKIIILVGLVIIVAVTVFLVVRHSYSLSADYNYITAKLDLKKGKCQLVNVGIRMSPVKAGKIDSVASRYGFTNIYIDTATPKERKGIANYNEVMEIYLDVRNITDWKEKYENEKAIILNEP